MRKRRFPLTRVALAKSSPDIIVLLVTVVIVFASAFAFSLSGLKVSLHSPTDPIQSKPQDMENACFDTITGIQLAINNVIRQRVASQQLESKMELVETPFGRLGAKFSVVANLRGTTDGIRECLQDSRPTDYAAHQQRINEAKTKKAFAGENVFKGGRRG
jgi:hypothetical protein